MLAHLASANCRHMTSALANGAGPIGSRCAGDSRGHRGHPGLREGHPLSVVPVKFGVKLSAGRRCGGSGHDEDNVSNESNGV